MKMNRTERQLAEEKIKVKHMALIIADFEHYTTACTKLIKDYNVNNKMNEVLSLLEIPLKEKQRHRERLSGELNRTFKKNVKDLRNDFQSADEYLGED